MTSPNYEALPEADKEKIRELIRRMRGKSHVADISIEDSPIENYKFKITVCKYSSSGNRGWATIGYVRHDMFHGGVWKLTYRPRLRIGEKSDAGRTGSYL